jgi:hypothetical protein
MLNLYTKLDIRSYWEQSIYCNQPKSRNVNWEKTRKTMYLKMFMWSDL